MFFCRVVRIDDHVFCGDVFGQPLVGAGRALDQFPFIFEQYFQVTHVPFDRVRFPSPFDAAADRVAGLAAAETALPTEALFLKTGCFRLGPHMGCRTGAVAFAERMAAGNQRDGFFVVHRHAGECFAYIATRGDRVGIAIRSFRIHIDQAHLHGCQRVFQITFVGITLVAQPFVL